MDDNIQSTAAIPSLYNTTGYFNKSEPHPLNVTNSSDTVGPHPSRDVLEERKRLLQQMQQSSATPPPMVTPVVAKQQNKGLKLSVSIIYNCLLYSV